MGFFKKRLFIIVALIIIVIIGVLVGISITGETKIAISALYGDVLNDNLIVSANGNKLELLNQKDTTVFYLSDSCSVCLEELPTIKLIYSTLSDNINVMLLWEGNIPFERLKTLNIPENLNYTLNHKAKINSGLTPQNFIIDSSKKVIFSNENIDVLSTIKKIINDYPSPEAKDKFFNQFDSDKVLLLFEDELYDIQLGDISKLNYDINDYSIIRITSMDAGQQKDYIYDKSGYIKALFGIKESSAIVVWEFGEIQILHK